ncbi:sugar phosphate isomerase/epimerase [Haloactinopolyspora alba]|uniref:Sugar phosphate isomerase/epimerase n=1 Tax=Haloactinopolyspora alba TaxID=648780 RepID=A0A2P8DJ66_9ACTN|nr:sugar phosphate isomerase/epimerase [Haloactinopolyspora alba]PSK97267.1 sugar phosphate isomerase/epimerase [Haloactinopolyspora alba]
MAHRGVNRRTFVRAAAGGAAALGAGAALGSAAAPAAAGGRDVLMPRGRVGLQLYSVRDKIAELGFTPVLEELARIGFRQIEFAGYSSPAEPGLTIAKLRRLLEDNGLVAAASHIGLGALLDPDRRQREFEIAAELGMPYIGTASNFPGDTVDEIKAGAERFDAAGAAAAEYGLRIYQHNHSAEFAPTADRPDVRRYDVFLENTDPRLTFFEMDILWAFGGARKYRQQLGDFNPADYVNADPFRYIAFHVKDGVPFDDPQRGHSYQDVVFGDGVIDFRAFFGSLRVKGRPLYLWEQDRAIHEQPDPPGSLGAAETSYDRMVALRG